jgi:hypothetical protein
VIGAKITKHLKHTHYWLFFSLAHLTWKFLKQTVAGVRTRVQRMPQAT